MKFRSYLTVRLAMMHADGQTEVPMLTVATVCQST